MKIFKKEDSLLEITAKCTTIAGVAFGAWAYFHTIHPVFEKEMELQNLRGESQILTSQIDELSTSLTALQQEKRSLLNSVASLQSQQKKLLQQVAKQELELREVTTNLENASDAAVLNKLQFYANKLQSAHLLAVVSGKEEVFDVLAVSKEILANHVPDKADEHAQQAYEYFKKYVEDHSGEEIKGDKVTEYALSVFFDYKIELLEQRIAAGQ